MSIEISDWNAEEDPRRFIDIIRSHLNFFFLGARGLSPSLDEIFCPRFETAILLDQFKTALIELADESLQGLNVFLRLVERRHLSFHIHLGDEHHVEKFSASDVPASRASLK